MCEGGSGGTRCSKVGLRRRRAPDLKPWGLAAVVAEFIAKDFLGPDKS